MFRSPLSCYPGCNQKMLSAHPLERKVSSKRERDCQDSNFVAVKRLATGVIDARTHDPERMDFELKGQLMHGSHSPSILFLHDSRSEAALFFEALANLENRGIRAAALDIAHPPKFHEILDHESIEISLQTVARQINSLDSFPLDIVGHGCGSVVALKLALMYPDKIRKLVLWGVPLPTGKDIQDCPVAQKEALMASATDLENMLSAVEQPVLCLAGDREKFQFSTLKAASHLKKGMYFHMGPYGRDAPQLATTLYVASILEFISR